MATDTENTATAQALTTPSGLALDKPLSLELKFPTRATDVMPRYEEVPDEFRRQSNPWVQWQQEWFFNGLKSEPKAKDGIDLKAALRHLSHIQRSWDTKHEHKECAVAYLANLWLIR